MEFGQPARGAGSTAGSGIFLPNDVNRMMGLGLIKLVLNIIIVFVIGLEDKVEKLLDIII